MNLTTLRSRSFGPRQYLSEGGEAAAAGGDLPLAGTGRLREMLGFGTAAEASRAAADGPTPEPKASGASLEQLLVQRATMGLTPAEIERVESLGYDGYLEYQLDYEAIDDSELEDSLARTYVSLHADAADVFGLYRNDFLRPSRELQDAALYRATYSPRQLFERMVIFWTDHFNIDIYDDSPLFLKTLDDREVIRRHALGKFPELLDASAHSPAMLTYLDNDTNFKSFPNENYARELMELHTLGADNGYTQEDVREVARCFTGWTFQHPFVPSPRAGQFRFDDFNHDKGKKTVLGQRIKRGGGVRDGEKVLEILAEHPNTADYLAEKLTRYLVGYVPPRSVVESVARAYRDTGGDIKAMVRTALSRSSLQKATPKLKRPFHYMVSVLRSLGAELLNPREIWFLLARAGHLPFGWSPPDGYPDDQEFWSGLMLNRWNFAFQLLGGELATVTLDLSHFRPAFKPKRLAKEIDKALANRTFSNATRRQLEGFYRAGARDQDRVAQTLALAFASPEFQQY